MTESNRPEPKRAGSRRSRRKLGAGLALVAAVTVTALSVQACSSTIPRRNPMGEAFPTVRGESLEEQKVELPGALAGAPSVLIIGYKQRAQFDIDRWVMGMLQAEVPARIIEVPTMPGLVPSMISGWIDGGMRSGIPSEDWSEVITLYGGSAKPVAKMTGTEDGNLARIIALDGQGSVVWFNDEGFSARKTLELAETLRALK